MLRLLGDEITARAAAARTSDTLATLADRLRHLLGNLAAEPPWFPEQKALLSRDGGVCPADGSRLRFDPDQPLVHRCGRCGVAQTGARHHRAWITRYQIWLSERAIHLALLGALGHGDLGGRAGAILGGYAERYRAYPNEDNVLGPSRLFFSTYLESIWLVQLSVAWAILQASQPGAVSDAQRQAITAMLAESAALIASYDEGWSNRQVWNGAAVLAAGVLLDDAALRATGEDDLRRLLRAVDPSGMWHEGENYHLFALRGFLLGAECARWQGVDLYADGRLGPMFAAPLATLLPDLTLPARGDAPYGVSVLQPPFAELWEVGRARTRDPRLDGILGRLYGAELPEGEDRGRAELAEQEEHRPPARQRRDRLGWKALLWMPVEAPAPGLSVRAPAIGEQSHVVLLRPDTRTVVSVECGRRSGGHAHPDLLHLSVFRERPLLADFGTGSYVEPSLHWYRSALAHNAPGRTGLGQLPGMGICEGLGQAGPWLWCRVRTDGVLGPDTTARRSVLLGPSWLLDVVTVEVPAQTTVDLPLHPLAGMPESLLPDAPAPGPTAVAGPESGDGHVEDLRLIPVPTTIPLGSAGEAVVCLLPRSGEAVLAAAAPGPPGADFATGRALRFLIRRAAGPGRWVQLLAWTPEAPELRSQGDAVDVVVGARCWTVTESDAGISVTGGGDPTVVFEARPVAVAPADAPATPHAPEPDCTVPWWAADALPFAPTARVAEWELGEAHYRRSELPHAARGGTRAHVMVGAQGDVLWLRVRVRKPDVFVRGPDAPDPALDNETPDIHSDGVQVYLGRDAWMGALVVPEFERGSVRVHRVAGTAAFAREVTGTSRRTGTGYEVQLRLPAGGPWRRGERCRFTVTVNEMVGGRERRSGQLAMAGAGWVWLRGDRESPQEALEAEIG